MSARVFRTALLALALLAPGCGARRGAATDPVRLQVDASRFVGELQELWRDHYDLSFHDLDYLGQEGFPEALAKLEVRSLRCSVGRWEIGLPVPPGGGSERAAELKTVPREFYRGPNTRAGADDPANYHLDYLDAQLAAITGAGIEPFLCFDYTPFTLARNRRRGGPADIARRRKDMSFSNGIRTSPPADPAVYARVVRHVIRHVKKKFGVRWIEIGNEPDLYGPGRQPLRIFWGGTREDFADTYLAIAREVAADPQLRDVRLGVGSFGMTPPEPSPTYLEHTVAAVARARARCDFVSYHSYDDDPAVHLRKLETVTRTLARHRLDARIVNGEWGRKLDGREGIYELVDFGLFRVRVMNLMQRHRVRFAHEALLRDPMRMTKFFGMLRAGSRPTKPVSAVYAAMNRLNGLGLRLLSRGGCDGCLLAAGDEAGGRLAIVYLDGGDLSGRSHPVELEVSGLAFRGPAKLRRLSLDDAGEPVVEQEENRSGATLALRAPASRKGPRLLLWEIRGTPTRRPVRGEEPPPAVKGDPVAELQLEFDASEARLREIRPRPHPDFQRRLEAHRKLLERLTDARKRRGEPGEVLGLARRMRETMGDLMERAKSTPPLARGLMGGYLKLSAAVQGALRQAGQARPAKALGRETVDRVRAVFGVGSPEARQSAHTFPD